MPAAVLLSNFTTDAKGMLLGTNIGGLGTLVASLASLISFKQYIRTPGAKPLRYLGLFNRGQRGDAGCFVYLRGNLFIKKIIIKGD